MNINTNYFPLEHTENSGNTEENLLNTFNYDNDEKPNPEPLSLKDLYL